MRANSRFGFLTPVALGLALTAATYTAASASVITFTWNPSATGNTSAGTFSADRFATEDFASIDTANLSHVTESGFLNFTDFSLAGHVGQSPVNTPGFSGYGMYLSFTATSHLSGPSSDLMGAFDTVSYTAFLYDTTNGLATFGFSGTTPTISLPAGANPLEIASGSGPIGGTPNLATIIDGVPGANVGTTWTPNSAQAAFYVSPDAKVVLDLESAFTNTPGVVTTVGPVFLVHGGGGNSDFFGEKVPVPEPTSIGMLGVGLLGLGLMRRRRQS